MARKSHDTVVYQSHSGRLLTRAVAVLLLLCSAECVAGSCLSYGHSCWGAHGKRSGDVRRPSIEVLPDWYLSSLIRRVNSAGDGEYPQKLDQIENLNSLNAIYRSIANNEGDEKLLNSLAVPMRSGDQEHGSRAEGILTSKLMKMARDASQEN